MLPCGRFPTLHELAHLLPQDAQELLAVLSFGGCTACQGAAHVVVPPCGPPGGLRWQAVSLEQVGLLHPLQHLPQNQVLGPCRALSLFLFKGVSDLVDVVRRCLETLSSHHALQDLAPASTCDGRAQEEASRRSASRALALKSLGAVLGEVALRGRDDARAVQEINPPRGSEGKRAERTKRQKRKEQQSTAKHSKAARERFALEALCSALCSLLSSSSLPQLRQEALSERCTATPGFRRAPARLCRPSSSSRC